MRLSIPQLALLEARRLARHIRARIARWAAADVAARSGCSAWLAVCGPAVVAVAFVLIADWYTGTWFAHRGAITLTVAIGAAIALGARHILKALRAKDVGRCRVIYWEDHTRLRTMLRPSVMRAGKSRVADERE
jgi:hypothetical protein